MLFALVGTMIVLALSVVCGEPEYKVAPGYGLELSNSNEVKIVPNRR